MPRLIRYSIIRADDVPNVIHCCLPIIMTRHRIVTAIVTTTAIAWAVIFVSAFYVQTLPNNPISRLEIWNEVPNELLNWIAPVKLKTAPPSGLGYLPQRFQILSYASLILAGIWGCGHLLLRALQPGVRRKCAERTVFAFGLGYSAFSLIALGMGLAGIMSRPAWLTITIAAALLELLLQLNPSTRRRREPLAKIDLAKTEQGNTYGRNQDETVSRSLKIACGIVMTTFVLAMIFGAMSPSRDFDVREYHIQGPKEWLQNGQITFLEHNVYTSFPFLTEMLTLIGMIVRGDWWEGALVGKLVLMSFAPLSALAVYSAGRRWFGARAGLFAATIFLTTPWIYRISIIAYAEGAITFFLIASLLAIGIVIDGRIRDSSDAPNAAPRNATRQRRTVLLAGLLAGSAMASKYPGVISVVIPMGFVLFTFWLKQRDRTAFGWMCVFIAGVGLTIGPWLVKNVAHTGNPVYPLVYSVFGGVDWNEPLDARWKKAHGPDHHKLSDLGRKALDVAVFSDWQSPLLFAFAPLALLGVRPKRALWLWLFVAWLFLTWWVLTHRLDRFWLPMIPVVCVLAGAGVTSRSGSLWRGFTMVVFIAAITFNFVFSTSGLGGYNTWLTDLPTARKNSAKAGLKILNQNLPTGARVLCVGEAEVFDAEFDLVYNTVFDDCLLERWATDENGKRNFDTLKQRLKDERITYIYVNWQEILRYRLPGSYQYTDFVDKKLFEAMEQEGLVERPVRLLTNTFGFLRFDALDENSRKEVEAWSPELATGNPPTFIRAELYRVLP